MRKYKLSEVERRKIIEEAVKYLNMPYSLRGDGIRTFNCSQFVVAVIKDALSIDLPPKVDWLYLVSEIIKIEDLQIGDLVFFCRQPRPIGRIATHVAIFVGNGQIIHARQRANKIVVEPISDFSETLIESKDLELLRQWLSETVALTGS